MANMYMTQAEGRIDGGMTLAARMLVETGNSCYLSADAFALGEKPNQFVSKVNETALNESDGVFAVLREGEQSLNVPAEVAVAVSEGKPVVIATDVEGSWLLSGWKSEDNVRMVGLSSKQIRKGVDWLNATFKEMRSDASAPAQLEKMLEGLRAGMNGGVARHLRAEGPIVFEAKSENAKLPERAYETDAGFDLFTSKTTFLPAGKTTYVPCGVAVDVPDGYWALVTGRSSTKYKLGLDVTGGVIDEGYGGELFAVVHNPTKQSLTIGVGDRLAQLILLPAVGAGQAEWGKVRPKPRGENGFGSSGQAEMHGSPSDGATEETGTISLW